MTIKYYKPAVLIFLAIGLATSPGKSQSIELLGGNALNGAINGVMLGGASMALENTNDLEAIRIGVGAGALYGISVGIYDVTQISKGEKFFISGTFNDGNNSTIIVLLDTIYGAAAGAVVATSVTLIINDPIGDALQYGSGIGAWIGFGFGLFDSFVLAERPGDYKNRESTATTDATTGGLLNFRGRDNQVNINFVNPRYYSFREITNTGINVKHTLGVDLLNFKVKL